MTRNDQETIGKALSVFLEKLSAEMPEIRLAMDLAKEGKITEDEAMSQMMALVKKNPDVERRLMEIALKELAPLREGEARVPAPAGEGPGSDIMTTHPVNGLPMLNPLYAAHLVERLQFDEDIPELRQGPPPPGTAAAVPVITKARSPVAIGKMLMDASVQVTAQLEKNQKNRAVLAERAVEGDPQALETIKKHGDLIATSDPQADVILWGSSDTDPEGYRRGEAPKPIKVERPDGGALARLRPEDQKELAWRFLSTTQGRVTGVRVVRDIVAEKLRAAKWSIDERDFDPKAPTQVPLAAHEWTVTLSGPLGTQASFSVLDVAANVLAVSLLKKLEGVRPERSYLEIMSVDRIEDRVVGWAARIVAC